MSERINKKTLATSLGVGASRISNLVKAGVLVFDNEGLIDKDEALQLIENSKQRVKLSEVKSKANTNDLIKHKTETEKWKSQREKLDFEKEKKLVVGIEEIKNDAYIIANSMKEQLLSIPERLCNNFAAEPDAMKIRDAMIKEIKKVLSDLSDKFEQVMNDNQEE